MVLDVAVMRMIASGRYRNAVISALLSPSLKMRGLPSKLRSGRGDKGGSGGGGGRDGGDGGEGGCGGGCGEGGGDEGGGVDGGAAGGVRRQHAELWLQWPRHEQDGGFLLQP